MPEPVVEEQNATTGQWEAIPTVADTEPVTPVTDDGDEPVAAKPADEKPKGKPRNDPEARIAQVVAKQREAERRAEDAERKARDLEAKLTPPPAPKVAPEKFPDYAAYLDQHPEASLEQWMDARDTWRDEKRDAQIQANQAAETTERTFTAKATAFGERYADAIKADADLPNRIDPQLLSVRPFSLLTAADKAAIRNIADPQQRDLVAFRCFLADQWIDSPQALDLLQHVSDPSTFQRLATLPPNQVIWELASLTAGARAASTKEPSGPALALKPKSQATAPISPVRGSSQPAGDEEPGDDASDDEWFRWQHSHGAKRRRA